VHISAMERMQTTLKKALRFVAALTMPWDVAIRPCCR
jgi:hypothetical protein